MNDVFQSSWRRAWHGLGAAGDGHAVKGAVLSRYAEPHRAYHTLQHLEECLQFFTPLQLLPDHPAEVEMALWFHDAIYELRSSSNEADSAAWAYEALVAAGTSPVAAARVRDLVLATKHTGQPSTVDECVLVDIDLSILGATQNRFAEYEQQIREEYAFVPDVLFKPKRREILASFLARPAIYNTPHTYQQLEQRARVNLMRAIGKTIY